MRFTTSGEVFYFRCAPVAGSSSIDACYNAAAQPHTGYAVDFLNNTLCLLPDDWFNILHLTEDALTLQADGGEPVFYVKVSASRVTVLTRRGISGETSGRILIRTGCRRGVPRRVTSLKRQSCGAKFALRR